MAFWWTPGIKGNKELKPCYNVIIIFFFQKIYKMKEKFMQKKLKKNQFIWK